MAKRLIDANQMLKNIELLARHEDTFRQSVILGVAQTIRNAPTVDAVEVILCRNCIHDGLSTCPMCYIEDKTLVFVNHDPDFYCGKGERRCEND